MRKVLLSGAAGADRPGGPGRPGPGLRRRAGRAAAAAAPSHPAAPGLYHVPIIGKVVLPGSGLPARRRAAPRHGRAVGQLGGLRRHQRHLQLGGGVVDRADASNCANSGGGLSGLLGGLRAERLLGGPSAASAFWVGLDGYTSTSVEQLGTDSDCNSGTPDATTPGTRCTRTPRCRSRASTR